MPSQTDKEVSRLLDQDGQMSSAEIARQLNDNPARTISYRVENVIARKPSPVEPSSLPLSSGAK